MSQNIIKFLQNAQKSVSSFFQSVGDFFKSIGKWCNKHWALTLAVVIGLVIFAAVTAALIFAWPAALAAIAAFTLTLPAIGTIVPFAFLAALSVPAAAAVVGALAFAAWVFVVAPTINLFAAAYNGLNSYFTKGLRKGDSEEDDSVEGSLEEVGDAYQKISGNLFTHEGQENSDEDEDQDEHRSRQVQDDHGRGGRGGRGRGGDRGFETIHASSVGSSFYGQPPSSSSSSHQQQLPPSTFVSPSFGSGGQDGSL